MPRGWTQLVLGCLPATTAQINAEPLIREMNRIHRAERKARGSWEKPVNSIVYDTLYRLRKAGLVERGEDGVYRRVEER